MKIEKKLSRALILLFIFVGLSLQNVFAAENLKVGVVNTSVLLENFVKYIDVQAILDKEFFSKDRSLGRKRNDIEAMRKELMGETTDITDDERSILERKISNIEREFVRLNDEFRQEFNLRRNEELYKIQKTINKTILDYAKSNKYDLILEGGVIYSESHLNITDEINAILIKENEETN